MTATSHRSLASKCAQLVLAVAVVMYGLFGFPTPSDPLPSKALAKKCFIFCESFESTVHNSDGTTTTYKFDYRTKKFTQDGGPVTGQPKGTTPVRTVVRTRGVTHTHTYNDDGSRGYRRSTNNYNPNQHQHTPERPSVDLSDIDKAFDGSDGQYGRDGDKGKKAVRDWLAANGYDPNNPNTAIPRAAVDYGHCVSYGLSGCDINSPERTWETTKREGITQGDRDGNLNPDDPVTIYNVDEDKSDWFGRCPKSRCGNGWNPPDVVTYTPPSNPGPQGPGGPGGPQPACQLNYIVITAHVSAGDNGCRPPSCPFGRDADGWCLPPPKATPPAVYILSPTADVDEGAGTAVFRVALSHRTTQDVTVDVATQDGTAVADRRNQQGHLLLGDYTALSKTVTVTAGSTSADVAVTVRDDQAIEPTDETFKLVGSNPSSNASMSTTTEAQATITDNDAGVQNLRMVCNSSTTGDFTLQADWDLPVGRQHHRYQVWFKDNDRNPGNFPRAGSAPWQGYHQVSRSSYSVTRSDLGGQTWYISVEFPGMSVVWTSATCELPQVHLDTVLEAINEGSSATVSASTDKPTANGAAVEFSLLGATSAVGGTACSGSEDFHLSTDRFVFTTAQQNPSVTITACEDDNDTIAEDGTLALASRNIAGLRLGIPAAARVLAVDNDTTISFAQDAYSITEGGTDITIEVVVDPLPAATHPLFTRTSRFVPIYLDIQPHSEFGVAYDIENGHTPGTGVFFDGIWWDAGDSARQTFTLQALDDTDFSDETVVFRLGVSSALPAGVLPGDHMTTTVTITDDDSATPPLLLPA